jgi:uncharacterized protein with FMN-binding domain
MSRRRRPARVARLGALVISCAATGGLALLFAEQDPSRTASGSSGQEPAIPTVKTIPPGASAGAGSSAGGAVGFDGDVVQTRYGPIEVQAQLRDGRLVEVGVVEYPSNDRRSASINATALPALRTEALTAQSANVDSVSGATYTSDGYTQSLQSALDHARAGGATTIT